MTIRPLMAAVTCLVLVATACGGGSEEPAAPTTAPPPPTTATPTTTAPPTTTTTTVAPTTTPATTTGPATTTTAAPLPDGDELLAALNRAMAQMPEFLATGRGFIKETADTPNDEAFVTQTAVGGGVAGGDFWQLSLLGFATPGLEQTFFAQERTVAGIDYEQDPVTGVWEIDESTDPDPVEDAFAGSLDLVAVTVAEGPSGFLVTGGYPADPTVESVTVEIDGSDDRLASITVRSTIPRSELQGLVPLEGDDLVATQLVDVTTYELDVAAVAAPPVGRATAIVPGPQAPFITSIPDDWERLSEADLQASGLTDAYLAPNDLALLMLTEDLRGSGIGSLEEYADVIATQVLTDFAVESSQPARTLQGGGAWIISGTDPTDGTAFRRLLYVSRDGMGVNLTFVQGIDEETGEPAESWDASRGLIDFMINSFMVRGG